MWRGGVFVGSVFQRGNRWYFDHRDNRTSFETRNEAQQYKTLYNLEHGLVVNQIRNVNDIVLEMKLIGCCTVTFDKDSYHLLRNKRWYCRHKGDYSYVVATIAGKYTYMHRLVFGQNVEQVDHIDRNPFNNVLSNLRDGSCGINQNNRKLRRTNTTGVNGICLRFYNGKEAGWRVSYQKHHKTKDRGFSFRKYGSKEAALKAAQRFRAEWDLRNDCSNGRDPLSYEEEIQQNLTDE